MTDQQSPGIGDNSGVQQTILDRTQSMITVANKWITERPVIVDDDMADKAASFLRQSVAIRRDVETARMELNAPLREQIASNDKRYNEPKLLLADLSKVISDRLNSYANEKRIAQERAAAEARRIAEAAATAAREAEEKKQEAIRKASEGEEVGKFSDVAATIAESKEAEQRAKQAQRDAAAASKAKPSFGGEHFVGDNRKAMTQRVVRTPIVVDALKVLKAVKTNDQINAALLTAARAYQKLKGKWPNGIEIEETTKVQ